MSLSVLNFSQIVVKSCLLSLKKFNLVSCKLFNPQSTIVHVYKIQCQKHGRLILYETHMAFIIQP